MFASTVLPRVATVSFVSLTLSPSSLCDKEVKSKKDSKDQKIVIIGGGTAGIGVAAMLKNAGMNNISIIEPKNEHYYQPLWTLVGAGIKQNEQSAKSMNDIIPSGVQWIKKSVTKFDPKSDRVFLEDSSEVTYDYLIVAAGIQIDWGKIPGLTEGLKKEGSGVVSIYDYTSSAKTWRDFQSIKHKPSRMIFTMSPTVLKCAGAPQKIMWLLEDTLRSKNLRDQTSVEFWTPGSAMFAIKRYSDQLEAIRVERGVKAVFRKELVAINIDSKQATFKDLDTNKLIKESYDLLHVAPPMSAPDFIKSSPLANEGGWVDVNKNTLQSTKFPNVFALGDCTSTPNSKTAAAITAQAPILTHNLIKTIDGQTLNGYYNGYASCPLIISRNKVILAEFGYDGKIMETFSKDTGSFPLNILGNEDGFMHRFFYFLKEQIFPFAY